MSAFSNERYKRAQFSAFHDALWRFPGSFPLIEFGGKPFDDQHAARVLPGYDPDLKAEILRPLMMLSRTVMVLNARDILQPPQGRYPQGRIRGDSRLFYKEELLRMIGRGKQLNLEIDHVIISISPRDMSQSENYKILCDLQLALTQIGVTVQQFYAINHYPKTDNFNEYVSVFERNGQIGIDPTKGVMAFSPGGGSGKFGVLLSEAYHMLNQGRVPNYIKFETFPIFDVDWQHPLNLAFLAATADLGNQTVSLGHMKTTYDKDVENFKLLKWLFEQMGFSDSVDHIQDPTDLGVNRIHNGIVDYDAMIQACRAEIARRVSRYQQEFNDGFENQSTVERAREIQSIFDYLYPGQKVYFIGPN